jgi:hypothetical protein
MTAREELEQFLYDHLHPTLGEGIDMHFMQVSVKNNPDKDTFVRILKAQTPENDTEFNWEDGKEYSFITIGAWCGSQHAALLIMALGTYFKLWKLMTPESLLGDLAPKELKDRMAGMGMVCVQSIAEVPNAGN